MKKGLFTLTVLVILASVRLAIINYSRLDMQSKLEL